MRFLSLVDFFSFGDKLVQSIHSFLLALNESSAYITASALTTIIVLFVAGLIIGLSSENSGEIFIQTTIFTAILVVMSALVNPLNLVFSHVNASYVVNRAKGFMLEYTFVFLLILLSAILAKKIASK